MYIKSKLQPYPSYVLVWERMGCTSIIRRLNEQSELESLYQHIDDYLVLGKLDQINEFTNGYAFINIFPLIEHRITQSLSSTDEPIIGQLSSSSSEEPINIQSNLSITTENIVDGSNIS
jgi:hypothetical protein